MTEDRTEEFRMLEESLLRPDVRRSAEELDALIADDFVEFGASGRVFSKQDVLEAAAADELPDVRLPLSSCAVKMLSEWVALLTYRSVTSGPKGAIASAIRSSVWVHDGRRWRLRFHQGTLTDREAEGLD